ncbi:hypothetical protein Lesp02_07130 [Lentzea sp. NBRC 105346]|nr:hypothetical protein Lesp02_07130 [Lentzea sp. NBRC 105346]
MVAGQGGGAVERAGHGVADPAGDADRDGQVGELGVPMVPVGDELGRLAVGGVLGDQFLERAELARRGLLTAGQRGVDLGDAVGVELLADAVDGDVVVAQEEQAPVTDRDHRVREERSPLQVHRVAQVGAHPLPRGLVVLRIHIGHGYFGDRFDDLPEPAVLLGEADAQRLGLADRLAQCPFQQWQVEGAVDREVPAAVEQGAGGIELLRHPHRELRGRDGLLHGCPPEETSAAGVGLR